MDLIFAGAGLVLLVIGGDLLVRGAVAASLRLGIPALIVSLTVVAFGTSAPELLIAVKSAIEGAPGIALGNVVGSNIANVFLVLGVPALISRLDTRDSDTRKSFFQMIAATAIFIVLCFTGPLGIIHGTILLVLLAGMIFSAVREARSHRADARAAAESGGFDDVDVDMADIPAWRVGLYIVAGLVMLPLGADFLIDGARGIAASMGVSEEVIGLTLVAVGTSLPELATTVMAAIRRQADVAIGNVIGSNIWNILAIMGVASYFGPLDVAPEFLRLDLWVMSGAALALAPFVFLPIRLGRRVGIGFIGVYAFYLWVLF